MDTRTDEEIITMDIATCENRDIMAVPSNSFSRPEQLSPRDRRDLIEIQKNRYGFDLILNVCGAKFREEWHSYDLSHAATELGRKFAYWAWEPLVHTSFIERDDHAFPLITDLESMCTENRTCGFGTQFNFYEGPCIKYDDYEDLKAIVEAYERGRHLCDIRMTSEYDAHKIEVEYWPNADDTCVFRLIAPDDIGFVVRTKIYKEWERQFVEWTKNMVLNHFGQRYAEFVTQHIRRCL
ncbi:hypothetical protein B5F76_07820 [Desulfovibrio sp. An276]|uniref:hypothetical protein n=1 Tax=Desulfovibrio sp. An276 TaxID=1965618 RepID=UPI000B3A09D0|nr:hypothetical protein [Desulfovibrio sp. An276]OUO52325.1 hypothetical protein B5F76_07820 [Desulfovibrio sp. An276]